MRNPGLDGSADAITGYFDSIMICNLRGSPMAIFISSDEEQTVLARPDFINNLKFYWGTMDRIYDDVVEMTWLRRGDAR